MTCTICLVLYIDPQYHDFYFLKPPRQYLDLYYSVKVKRVKVKRLICDRFLNYFIMHLYEPEL